LPPAPLGRGKMGNSQAAICSHFNQLRSGFSGCTPFRTLIFPLRICTNSHHLEPSSQKHPIQMGSKGLADESLIWRSPADFGSVLFLRSSNPAAPENYDRLQTLNFQAAWFLGLGSDSKRHTAAPDSPTDLFHQGPSNCLRPGPYLSGRHTLEFALSAKARCGWRTIWTYDVPLFEVTAGTAPKALKDIAFRSARSSRKGPASRQALAISLGRADSKERSHDARPSQSPPANKELRRAT
jgi:hypothetical protein